jgi:hypothetical protein
MREKDKMIFLDRQKIFTKNLNQTIHSSMALKNMFLGKSNVTFAFLLLGLCSLSGTTLHGADDTFFETKIRPALIEHCYSCHSLEAGEASGDLLLDTASKLRRGGSRGAAINLEKPQESLLLYVISYQDDQLKMPPDSKLPDDVIADFRTWIEQGAPDPRADSNPDRTPKELLAQRHWAYQAPKPYEVELSKVTLRSSDPIDVAIESRLKSKGIAPSDAADRITLLKRLSYDLWGLPPTAELMDEVKNDNSPDAYRRLVDRLLAAPQFGERWARHWMDVSRYADTKGYVFQEDRNYATAYRYRDWLIRAFNQDMPYDQFVQYQLAADKLDPANEGGHLDAMGFLTLGRRFLNNKNDIIDDRLDVVGRGLMGLTISCARCHDHKFDPVSIHDYYSLYGVFLNSDEPGGDPSPLRLVDSADDRQAFVFLRGQAGNHGDKVNRKFVKFLSPDPAATFSTGSGRNDLAKEILRGDNPLTARVIVNRIWIRLMGESMIDSPSDLGVRCPPPVLQDVLDELSTGLVENGWSLKYLIRRIVLSATYQQSSLSVSKEALAMDPENSMLWRMNRKRIDFEALRDSILAVTNGLDRTLGGPSVNIHTAPFTSRRTVYAFIDRQNLPGLFRSFDVASPDTHNPKRSLTTVPQQGLFLLNSDWIALQTQRLAEQLAQENSRSGGNDKTLVELAFKRILNRLPSEMESQFAMDFLVTSRATHQPIGISPWSYGYGRYLADTGSLESFNAFPAFVDGVYRGAKPLPDDKLGWVSINAEGGHPGQGPDFAAIRRWTAPSAGTVQLIGQLIHPSEHGDGVRAAIVVSGKQRIANWDLRNGKADTKTESFQVKRGDTVDFIVECGANESNDSFRWKVAVRLIDQGRETYSSQSGFGPPPPNPFGEVDQLVQALLASNELAFVD